MPPRIPKQQFGVYGNPREEYDNTKAALSGFTGLGDEPSVMNLEARKTYDNSELSSLLSNLVPGKGALSGGAGALGVMKRLYHGGSYVPGTPIKSLLYAAPDRRMAESYVEMARDRFGGTPKVYAMDVDLDPAKMAPERIVRDRANFFGIPYDDYTPASAFDKNLHGDQPVNSLMDALASAGYDHTALPDMPYGFGRGGVPKDLDETAYVLMPRVAPRITEVPEHKMFQALYRGYAGNRHTQDAIEQIKSVYASPQREVAERYAMKRAGEGKDPHVEMLMVDPFAGRKYGHAVMGKGKDRPLTTMARELNPDSDVQDVHQLYARGGLVQMKDGGQIPSEDELAVMSQSDLLDLRRRYTDQKQQESLAPYEHRAFAREAVTENPLSALGIVAGTPVYAAGKALGVLRGRTPASLEQVRQGFVGSAEGLKAAFDKFRN